MKHGGSGGGSWSNEDALSEFRIKARYCLLTGSAVRMTRNGISTIGDPSSVIVFRHEQALMEDNPSTSRIEYLLKCGWEIEHKWPELKTIRG